MNNFLESQQKNIAIFTNFFNADPAYSLNRVVQDQIKMLVNNGYKITVIASEGFKPVEMYAHENVTMKYVPSVPCHNEVKKDQSFDDDVESIYQSLSDALNGVDVVLSHDLVYQPSLLKHNFAARRYAMENTNIKWLHWIHSATSPYRINALLNIFSDKYTEVIKTKFPNSKYIYFNHYSIPRIAHNFGIEESDVAIVHHPIDIPSFYGFDDKVTDLYYKKKFYQADAILTYPCRLDDGKQVEMAVKTMAMLKELQFNVRVVVVDFHSTGGPKLAYRDKIKNIAIDYGLNAMEMTFTSEWHQDWFVQVDHKIVRDFLILSNVFIMPSVSESYSLVTQEAGVDGKVVVANKDFPPFRDIFGQNVIYRQYSSDMDVMTGMDGRTTTNYGPANASDKERQFHERNYHKDTAKLIASRLRLNDSLALQIKLRTERNTQTVFQKELEPLFY